MPTIEILLAEDDPAHLQLMTEALRDPRIPYHVSVVKDGEEALSFLRQEPPNQTAPRPDLILLDLNLPKIDGRRFLTTIKADPSLRDIPVIVVSVSDNPSDIREAYRNQAAGFINKSSDLNEYFTSIRLLKQLWFNVMKLPKTSSAGSGR